jgi:predicted metal-dependent hydrolase
MDDTERVLERLARIERLRESAPATTLLDELRLLLPEAEAWVRAEGDARARAAVEKLRKEAEGMR